MLSNKLEASKSFAITIILPCFNAKDLLEDCFQSILTFKESCPFRVELVVVDGSSNDNSSAEYNLFANVIDVLISEPDSGIYDAMNKAVRIAQGRWIYFTGADDRLIISGDTLAGFLLDAKTCYYGYVLTKSSGKPLGGAYSKFTLLRRNIPHQAIFYARSAFRDCAYNLDYTVLADFALNIEIFSKTQFEYFDMAVAIFDDVNGVSARESDGQFQLDRAKLYLRCFGLGYYFCYLFYSYSRDCYRLLLRGMKSFSVLGGGGDKSED